MQYLVDASDCARLHFQLKSLTTNEINGIILKLLNCASPVDSSLAISGALLASIDSLEELDSILRFPSLIHRKTAFSEIRKWQVEGVPFLAVKSVKVLHYF